MNVTTIRLSIFQLFKGTNGKQFPKTEQTLISRGSSFRLDLKDSRSSVVT